MKYYVSYKSYLWNFKGYEPPMATNTSNKIIELDEDKLTEDVIKKLRDKITDIENENYGKRFGNFGHTEVVMLGITKLDEEIK